MSVYFFGVEGRRRVPGIISMQLPIVFSNALHLLAGNDIWDMGAFLGLREILGQVCVLMLTVFMC